MFPPAGVSLRDDFIPDSLTTTTMPPPNPLRHQVISIYKGAHPQPPFSRNPRKLALRRSSPPTYSNHSSYVGPPANPHAPELLYLGREDPLGFSYFRPRLHKAFMANSGVRDEAEIRKCLERADFVKRGVYLPFPPQSIEFLYLSVMSRGKADQNGRDRGAVCIYFPSPTRAELSMSFALLEF